MTKETLKKANQLATAINGYEEAIYSLVKTIDDQTIKTDYPQDTLNVEIYNGSGKASRVYLPRRLVKEILNSAIETYQKEKAKLQAELDVL